MKIETANTTEQTATPERIRELVRDDAGRGEYMIMMDDADEERFVQIACDYEDVGGANDGCFDLEYREGEDGALYHCTRRVGADDVERIFLEELAGRGEWRKSFTWERIDVGGTVPSLFRFFRKPIAQLAQWLKARFAKQKEDAPAAECAPAKKRKSLTWWAARGIAAGLVAWGGSALAISWASAGRVFDPSSLDQVPHSRAAVVLGCRKILPGGFTNLFFTRRMAAAAKLYKAGKVDCLIVSGDNHIKEYDEATDMKDSLIAVGVPAERIVCDYAGFRTLDSVVRAKKVFGLDSFLVVSQEDHVRRAVFLARGFGCDAYGYAAQNVNGRYSIRTTIREQFAKVAAVLDVIFRRGPKFLGPREPLPAAPGERPLPKT